jgi:hypothetical protein
VAAGQEASLSHTSKMNTLSMSSTHFQCNEHSFNVMNALSM